MVNRFVNLKPLAVAQSGTRRLVFVCETVLTLLAFFLKLLVLVIDEGSLDGNGLNVLASLLIITKSAIIIIEFLKQALVDLATFLLLLLTATALGLKHGQVILVLGD